jgi:hypothetical protein
MLTFARWLFVLLLILSGAMTWAQVDPGKALIGTWEGQAETLMGLDQILIINSVQPTGEGEWIARGRFGSREFTKTGPGGQEMTVTTKDNQIYLEFAAKGN